MARDVSLERLQQLVEATFDQLPYPAFIYDNASTIVAVNQAGQSFLGSPSDKLTGRPCAEIFHCRTCELGCGILAGLKQREAAAGHTALIATNAGREHLAYLTVSPLTDSGGGVQGALAIVTCLTEPPMRQRQTIVAASHRMREVFSLARRVAASEADTILLEGETGTGKELVARLLHDDSRRRTHPFVAINCAAMPEALLESELFGYERGAFTDARSSKRGLLELADKGTLFLDEIGELPLAIQAKLLRVLDDQSFRRLGGLQDIRSDIRIVAATNRDLLRAVTEGSFRGDLYYRVNVIELTIPPLRERRDDILPLARFFLEHFCRKFKRRPQELPAETAQLLIAYNWPGNVRELRNLIERSVLLQDNDSIPADSLPFYVQNRAIPIDRPVPVVSHVGMSLRENEQLLIANALTKANGNQSKAAKLLGIGRDALRYRLKNGNRVSRRFTQRVMAQPEMENGRSRKPRKPATEIKRPPGFRQAAP